MEKMEDATVEPKVIPVEKIAVEAPKPAVN